MYLFHIFPSGFLHRSWRNNTITENFSVYPSQHQRSVYGMCRHIRRPLSRKQTPQRITKMEAWHEWAPTNINPLFLGTMPIPWLLISWFLATTYHQHPRYWYKHVFTTDGLYCSMGTRSGLHSKYSTLRKDSYPFVFCKCGPLLCYHDRESIFYQNTPNQSMKCISISIFSMDL